MVICAILLWAYLHVYVIDTRADPHYDPQVFELFKILLCQADGVPHERPHSFVEDLLVNLRGGLGVTESHRGHVFQDGHLHWAVTSVQERHQGATAEHSQVWSQLHSIVCRLALVLYRSYQSWTPFGWPQVTPTPTIPIWQKVPCLKTGHLALKIGFTSVMGLKFFSFGIQWSTIQNWIFWFCTFAQKSKLL